MGDFIEVLGEERSEMHKFISQCRLVDVIARTHLSAGFSTYQRGRTVLDYCLMDEALTSIVSKCGYQPFKANIVSDHQGLFVDFPTSHLFLGGIQPLVPMPLQEISTKKMHQLPPYFAAKEEYLKECGWFERTRELQDSMDQDESNDHLAEILYSYLIKASAFACGGEIKALPICALLSRDCAP
jgi:hypothetical protein